MTKQAGETKICCVKGCNNKATPNGKCRYHRYINYYKAYRKTDKYKAYQKAYRKIDKYKAYQKAYQKTDKYKAYQKAYRKIDKYKAYQKAYQKTDKFKAYQKAYQKTDKFKAYQKAYRKRPEVIDRIARRLPLPKGHHHIDDRRMESFVKMYDKKKVKR